MLKFIFSAIIITVLMQPALARTNYEIGNQLYAAANRVAKQSPARAEKMKEDIASFLIDLNMLNFKENRAVWKRPHRA